GELTHLLRRQAVQLTEGFQVLNHGYVTAGLTSQDAAAGGLNDEPCGFWTAEASKANAIENASSASSGASFCSALKAFIYRAVMSNDNRILLE
ncbi:hypothetical protein, partial [Pseudomonas viridiflava]|uniref:hypothetical protein n=1 Tax=Pseudomonas viridiflava TaxID=33069 RepID=UPI0019807914